MTAQQVFSPKNVDDTKGVAALVASVSKLSECIRHVQQQLDEERSHRIRLDDNAEKMQVFSRFSYEQNLYY